MLAACMIAVAYRMISATTDANRAIAADLLMFSFTGILAILGVILAGDFFFDLILVASVVGFLSAVSLARTHQGAPPRNRSSSSSAPTPASCWAY